VANSEKYHKLVLLLASVSHDTAVSVTPLSQTQQCPYHYSVKIQECP
jgi:hypothetical protein